MTKKQDNKKQNKKQNQNTGKNKTLATVTREISGNVQNKIAEYINKGQLNLPANYSVGNAVRSAFLTLQEKKTKDKQPVLEACTEASIYNALMKMAVLGLDPGKKQVDFIAHYNQLICRPSYFGNEALVKRLAGVRDVLPEVVYVDELEGFKVSKKNNRTVIEDHDISSRFKKKKETLDSPDDIAFAYCTLEFKDNRPDWTDIMDIEQIKQAWRQGEVFDNEKVNQKNIFHYKFTKDACIRTIINHTCKRYINSSDDSSLIIQTLKQTNVEAAEIEAQQAISDNANTVDIDTETPDFPSGHNQETGEVQEQENLEDVQDKEWDINEGGELFNERPAKSNINEEV